MIFIDNRSTDPYFNLALEEYLFKKEKEVVMLWQNDNAIVVGKHQNTLSEINYPVVLKKDIKVVRRLSGGGTVFHDLGNINFTFIQNGEREKLVDFTRFLAPVISALAQLGLEAYQGKRNEIMLKGKKISGNAEHTFKNRVLHHGTLLFDTALDVLISSLRVNPLKFEDKAIKSVQSRVTNIVDHLDGHDINSFRDALSLALKSHFSIAKNYELSPDEIAEVKALANEKYNSWEWNFGYSPSYKLSKSIEIEGETKELSIEVKKGLIVELKSNHEVLEKSLSGLEGQPHRLETVEQHGLPYDLETIDLF